MHYCCWRTRCPDCVPKQSEEKRLLVAMLLAVPRLMSIWNGSWDGLGYCHGQARTKRKPKKQVRGTQSEAFQLEGPETTHCWSIGGSEPPWTDFQAGQRHGQVDRSGRWSRKFIIMPQEKIFSRTCFTRALKDHAVIVLQSDCSSVPGLTPGSHQAKLQ